MRREESGVRSEKPAHVAKATVLLVLLASLLNNQQDLLSLPTERGVRSEG